MFAVYAESFSAEGVPVFLLPANPVSALVVFEVMVRPLIRLSLGKRQPMRRIVLISSKRAMIRRSVTRVEV